MGQSSPSPPVSQAPSVSQQRSSAQAPHCQTACVAGWDEEEPGVALPGCRSRGGGLTPVSPACGSHLTLTTSLCGEHCAHCPDGESEPAWGLRGQSPSASWPCTLDLCSKPPALPYLGRGAGSSLLLQLRPSTQLALALKLLVLFRVEAFGHTFWMQWPVIFVVQVRKLKAENGSRVVETSPGSPLCLQPPGLGGPHVRSGWEPRLAAQVQRCPSTTTHCSCRAATVSPQAGGQAATPHPLVRIYALGLGADPGLCSVRGLYWLLARAGCVHCTAVGQEASITRQGCGKSLAAPRGAVVEALWGADKAPALSPGGLGTGSTSPGGLGTFHSFGKVTC